MRYADLIYSDWSRSVPLGRDPHRLFDFYILNLLHGSATEKEKKIMANKKLIIENMGEVNEITQGLLWSGYEVSITPVYEEPEKEDRGYRPRHRIRAQIKHFVIDIGEKIEAPEVDPVQF